MFNTADKDKDGRISYQEFLVNFHLVIYKFW
jgi:Ca2+-binding EF-hand superfamily protein